MAIRAASKGFKRNFLSRSELILGNLPRFVESNDFEHKYKDFLKGIKIIKRADASNFLIFPRKSFNRFSFNSIEQIIKSTHNILKEKNVIYNTETCNNLLKSYLTYDLEFDASELFNNMTTSNIPFNEQTFSLLIEFHSGRGEMDSAEKIVNVMKAQKIPLLLKSKYSIVSGYIRAGRIEDSKKFIAEEKIDENNTQMLIEKAKAYADIGDFNEVIEHINKISESDPDMPGKICIGLYRRLVKAKASDSELDQIIALVNENSVPSITECIFYLNRFGFYNYSLKVMLKFPRIIIKGNVLSDIITSFNHIDCPANVYKTVLEHFIDRVYPSTFLNLFANMKFDKAIKMTESLLSNSNYQCLVSNLFMKAIKDKSPRDFQEAFRVGLQTPHLRNLSTMMQFVVLPASLSEGLLATPEDLLPLMPQHRGLLLPIVLMHLLTRGQFAACDALLEVQRPGGTLHYLNFSRSNAKTLVEHVPFSEIGKVAAETRKVFSPLFSNFLIGSVVSERIVQLSEINDEAAIEAAVATACDLGVTFEPRDLAYIDRAAHRHMNLLKGLVVVETGREDTDKSVAKVQPHVD